MSNTQLIVFKGHASQTGLAFTEEFANVPYQDTKYEFDEIRDLIKGGSCQVALPIWNSHYGEIDISHALSMLFDELARLYMLWPKSIEFECITKEDNLPANIAAISVKVARIQCSEFVTQDNVTFTGVDSTTEAYELFKSQEEYNAALVAPGQNIDNYKLYEADVSNPINFTTFALLASKDSGNWDVVDWGQLADRVTHIQKIFSGIQMPFSDQLSESQEELFDRLIDDAISIDDVPKVLFVSRHDDSKCRLILEADHEFVPTEILDEDGSDEYIRVLPDVGQSAEEYSKRIESFLQDKEYFKEADFLYHKGTHSCFFACPILGIITHGFDDVLTEFFVRQMIRKCFELLDSGAPSTPEQRSLFEKHKNSYYEHGIDFVSFSITV